VLLFITSIPVPKVTDELIVGPKNQELVDFYVRNNKKVLLGQVKVPFINSKMKFKTDAGLFILMIKEVSTRLLDCTK